MYIKYCSGCCTIYKNPVNGLAPFRVLVAQLVEHPPSVRKVMGSNPIGDSDFFPSLFICVSTIPLKHKKEAKMFDCIEQWENATKKEKKHEPSKSKHKSKHER